ncbi:hypothetical protein CXU13_09635 [Akkermansia muciniphila]|nr:hypothetical protein CXU12_04730 [Akkermansia muciniphila]PNC58778.1 hypothetical protein CXU13_09635 [Akkermansia muciniphila]
MRKLNWCGWVPAVLAACSLAHAEEIGIGVLNGTAATEAAFRQAEPGTLAEEGKTWNFIKPAANAATTVSSLKTAAGVSTEASCAINPGYCASNGIFASGRNRDYLLMDSWAGIRGTENVVISRLPDSMAEYCHVEIYGDCNDSDRDMLYTVNGLTGTIQDRGTFSGAFQEGVNRLTLKYVPVTGGTITITGNGASQTRSAINAVRLTAPSPGIVTFTATPSEVMEDSTSGAVLSWKTWKCGAVTLSTRDGRDIPATTEDGTGSVTVKPDATTTYILSAACEDGTVSKEEVTVTVRKQEPEILLFESDKKRVAPGSDEKATLTWSTVKAESLALTANGAEIPITSTAGAGSVQVSPAETTQYTLTLTAADGTEKSKSLIISVLAENTPNVLVFLVDDMGWQDTSVPFYYKDGQPVVTELNAFYKTPSMERLAAQGMKFTNAYSCPLCSPGRTSLMTGKTSARHRVTNWTAVNAPTLNEYSGGLPHIRAPQWNMAGMSQQEIPLPRVLKDAGYRTITVGKAHFAPSNQLYSNPANLGFDVNIAGCSAGQPASYRGEDQFGSGNTHVPDLEEYYGTTATEDRKRNFLTNALTLEMKKQIKAAVDENAPFFAYMTHYAVHQRHDQPDPNGDYDTYPSGTSFEPGVSIGGNLRNFGTLIGGMDKSLGDLMDYLKELGVANRTLVIFMSDNGGDAPIQQSYSGDIPWLEKISAVAPLRGRKGSRYEGGTRIPMIVGWAEADSSSPIQQEYPIPQNSVNHDIVAIWDIYPTILNMLKLKVPVGHQVDGEDISPYFRGDSSFHRTQKIFQHFPHHHSYANFYSTCRKGDWKVIYNYMDQYAHTDLYSGNGYRTAGRFPWQLFNLKDDIGESNDLAQDPAQQERLMRMARSLIRELRQADAQYPVLTRNGQVVGTAYIRMPDFPDVDSDGDGVPDLVEDANGNGVIDPGETDPDDASSFVPIRQ